MFKFTTYNNISLINELDWNNCAGDENPFLSYKFFKNLEDSEAIGIKTSWVPSYICISKNNNILAYIPLFIKLDSQGEYVFDHTWANAYYNAGGKYYPKIQSSIPYTPVTGNRILINKKIKNELILTIISEAGKYIEKLVNNNNISSAHITFCTYKECNILSKLNFLKRIGEQYHWQNKRYESFENFLDNLESPIA